jgi:hypothetical protein
MDGTSSLERVYPGGAVPVGWKLLAQARVESPHVPATDLALAVGVSAQTIRIWTRKPEYQRYENWVLKQEYDKLVPNGGQKDTPVERLKEKVFDYADECFERLKDIIETSQDPKLVSSLSQDILDRAGVAPVKEIKHSGQRAMIVSEEVLRMFAARAIEAGVEPVLDNIIDADVEDEARAS